MNTTERFVRCGQPTVTELRDFDEASLLWVAAFVEEVDPLVVLDRVDMAELAALVAEIDAIEEPIDAAARLLVRVVRDGPFPTSNNAIGWLAAVDLLRVAQLRIDMRAPRIAALCRSIRTDELDVVEVASVLRHHVVLQGMACPACGKRVYVRDAAARRGLMPGATRFELTARCAFEHGGHDRRGQPVEPAPERVVSSCQPVLARGACGSFLVAGAGRGLVLSPYCDEPPIYRVVEVVDIVPGDLVGRWDLLVERSSTVGFVHAEAVCADDLDRVDLDRLDAALAHGGQQPAAGDAEARENLVQAS